MGTGHSKSETVTSSEVQRFEQLIPKDSYIYSDRYKELDKLRRETWEQLDEAEKAEREIYNKLKNKPIEEYDEDEMILWEELGLRPIPDYHNPEYVAVKGRLDRLQAQFDETTQKMRSMINEAFESRGGSSMTAPTRTTQKEFKGFSTTSTGMSYYNDFLTAEGAEYMLKAKGMKAYIAEMSPKEYMTRCAKQIFSSTIERQVQALETSNVAKYKVSMQGGVKFDMPVLDYARGTQEGRHRAYVANELGIKKIPVLIVEEA